MKRNTLIFGSVAGLIVAAVMVITMVLLYHNNYQCNMYVGYGSMIIALSLMFVAVKNYRDKYNGGVVSFGKAFMIGFYVALIASTIYVATWLIIYYAFMPDFMDRYATFTLNKLKTDGATAEELSKELKLMNTYKEAYKNPLFIILLTYLEILPVGLVIALLSALILKKKPGDHDAVATA